jgi:hypothetical protein
MCQNLTFEKIKADTEKLILSANDSYIKTYPEFVTYFTKINLIEKHHLFIASHFVYGWMPTIIKLNTTDIDKVLILLNKAKNNHLLVADELEVIKKCLNNSLVGTSKILHFINPKLYAIWDSKIFRYIYKHEKKSTYGIANPQLYLNYLTELKSIINNFGYNDLHSKIEKKITYHISPMRAIELVMFETIKKMEELEKEKKY